MRTDVRDQTEPTQQARYPSVLPGWRILLAAASPALPALFGSPRPDLLVLSYLLFAGHLPVLWAKHQPVLDLACVAAGFVLRAVAGGVAVGIPTSTWFLTVTAASAMFVVSGNATANWCRKVYPEPAAV